jgi:predicted nicotinamide N-methyase
MQRNSPIVSDETQEVSGLALDLPPWLVEQVEFFFAHTLSVATPSVPEIVLRLGDEAVPLWNAIERKLGLSGRVPPYWAFAWPGGQAVARYVLDHPHVVAGRRVLDFGSGSGIVAIAAAKAGAAHVLASDIDSLAGIAIAMNADANGVTIEATVIDVLREESKFDLSCVDVILAGDMFYDHVLSVRATVFLQRCRAAGCDVLLGDPGRADLPTHLLSKIGEYLIPVSNTNQYTAAVTERDGDKVCAYVWELNG